jgi:hypothetical protein
MLLRPTTAGGAPAGVRATVPVEAQPAAHSPAATNEKKVERVGIRDSVTKTARVSWPEPAF